MYSSNSRQWKKLEEDCCCVCKTIENSEIFIIGFIQHRYYGSIFTSFLLHSLSKNIGKCCKGIYGY